MGEYRMMRMIEEAVSKQTTSLKQTSKLYYFEFKVDNGGFHLKTNRGNFTSYLCSWSIQNFSLFKSGESKGFQGKNYFSYSVNHKVAEETLLICIYSQSYCKYDYSVTISTDLGTELFRQPLIKASLTRIWIKNENFQKLKQLPNDTLVLTCRLTCSEIDITPSSSMQSLEDNDYLESLQAELKKYSRTTIKEKVKLSVGTETEFVNKAIICARSPVFAKMFENNMQEIRENNVIITDIKMPVLKALVSFLYSGFIQDYDINFLFALYYCSAKYQIAELQLACTKSILGKVSEENICRVLNLASLHNDELLKSAAMTLICANFETIAMTSEWKNLMHEDPETGLMASRFLKI